MSAQQMKLDTSDAQGVAAGKRQFITFTCAGQSFGIDIMAMREIRNWSPVTPLPAQKPDVLGVIDIRGRVVPVHDLALRIGCSVEQQAQHEGQVILVLRIDGHDMGLLVDTVSDIIEVDAGDILAVPQIEGSAARFLAGIARQDDTLVAILDEQAVRVHAVEHPETQAPAAATNAAEETAEFVFVDDVGT